MKDIVDLFKPFKSYHDLTPIEYQNVFLPYYQSFFKNRRFPRFFQSYLYLRAERKYFYYGYINNCLIVVKKKKEFGNKVFYLVFPPMHQEANLEEELKLISYFQQNGIKSKISNEDISLYNLSTKEYRKDKDNIEMIYDSSHFINLNQPTYFKFRYNLKKLLKYQQEQVINLKTVSHLNTSDIDRINHLVQQWSSYKTNKSSKAFQADKCHLYFNNITNNTYFEALDTHNKIITSSICEELSPGKGIITTNYSDYHAQIHDLQSNKALHCVLMQYYHNKSPNYLLNSGSGGWDQGLTAHKRQLRPVQELQIYDTKIYDKLTEEEYQYMCQGFHD